MKLGNKVEKWAGRGLWLIFLLLVAFLLLASLWETTYVVLDEVNTYDTDSLLLHGVFVVAALTVLVYALPRLEKISSQKLLLALILYTLVAGNMLIFITQVEPANDQKDLILLSQQYVVDGNWTEAAYIQKNPHQIGMLLVVMACTWVTHTGAALLVQSLNVVVLCGCYWGLYGITRHLFKKQKVTNLLLVLCFCFLPLFFYVIWVYGNLPGLLFSLLAMWMQLKFLDAHRLRHGLLSAVFIALAVVLRQTNLIVLIAMAVYYAVYLLKTRRLSALGIAALCVLLSLAGGSVLSHLYGRATGSNTPLGLPPVVYTAMGLRDSGNGPGWYDPVPADALRLGFENNEARRDEMATYGKQMMMDLLKEHARNPLGAVRFFYRKAVSMWNNPTFQCFWIGTRRDSQIAASPVMESLYEDFGFLNTVVTLYMDQLHTLILLGVGAYIWWLRKKGPWLQLYLALPVVGYFFFHLLFWEAKAQYALVGFVLFLPYASVGLCTLSERWGACLRVLHQKWKGKPKQQTPEKSVSP